MKPDFYVTADGRKFEAIEDAARYAEILGDGLPPDLREHGPRVHLPLFTASKLDLAEHCLYPWTSGHPWDSGTKSKSGHHGNAVHEFSAGLLRGCAPSQESLADKYAITAPGDRRKLEAASADLADHLAGLPSDAEIQAEIAIAFWPETGEARVLPAGEERPPEASLFYVDVLIEIDGHCTVLDWKTGRRPIQRRVKDTPQVRAYALAVAVAFGLEEVRVELGWLSNRGLWIDPVNFDAFDLAVIEEELRALEAERRRGGTVPNYGLHCVEGWCPIMGSCEAAQAAAAEVERHARGRFPLSIPTSDEHAVDLYHRIPLARAYLDRLETTLEEWATSQGALDLGDGVAWGKVEKRGNESVACTPEAVEILQTHLEEYADVAIRTEVSTSKSEIARAVKTLVSQRKEKRGAQKRRYEPILEALREAGALRSGQSYFAFDKFKRATQADEEGEG